MSSFNLPAARIAAAKSKAAQYIDLAAKCDALIASLLDLVGEVEALERAADDDLRGCVDDRGEQAPRSARTPAACRRHSGSGSRASPASTEP